MINLKGSRLLMIVNTVQYSTYWTVFKGMISFWEITLGKKLIFIFIF